MGGCLALGFSWGALGSPPGHRLGEQLGPEFGKCSSDVLPGVGCALTCPHPASEPLSRAPRCGGGGGGGQRLGIYQGLEMMVCRMC